jgi:ABC-type multidrug transport system fused ATPase/permease subunit
MGSKLKSDSELNEVLTDSFVEEFLPNLPDGLDTHVGPRGANISGGQRQRILIARALFRDKPILILDEPTSSLDSKSEKVIESALDKLAHGRTTIVVAHRLSTIMNADRILVLKSGVIVEVGSHKELLSNGSYYRELVNSQLFEKNN